MITTAEPGRKRAYDNDLRWRIVYQRIGMDFTYQKIAQNLNISISTCQRIFKRFETSSSIEPTSTKTNKSYRCSLDSAAELYLIGVVLESPSLYLDELCSIMHDTFNILVSPPTICRILHRYGITRKKIRQVAVQRCYTLRGAFMAQTFMYKSHMFVWVDETGCDNRTHIRKYGYALLGTTPTNTRLLVRGQRYNAIAAMSSSTVLALEVIKETVNGDRFFDFLRGTLIPQMHPFDGQSSNSILVLDNCTVHHVVEVRQLLQSAGILTFFLPPYSPDMNPIEELFSYVKQYLRRHDELLLSIPCPITVIKAAFNSITQQHCQSWVSHAGYID